MGWRDRYVDVSELRYQTFTKVIADEYAVRFENDEVRYTLYHEKDCCEEVYVEDIIGDLEDLQGWPILVSNEVQNPDEPPLCDNEESYTWTFYNFATFKGYVTIRFYGTSNGFYSEDVSCIKEILKK